MGGTAVLFSAGLDSAVLAAAEAQRGSVHAVYVSCGLAWESAELEAVDRLLATPPFRSVGPAARLTFTAQDLYPPSHWALTGHPPSFDTPDEDVYLTGRNVMLLSKAGIYCASAGIARLVIGTLDHNPFPDATPAFRAAMASALTLGLAHPLTIEAPYAQMSKADVIRRGAALGVPLPIDPGKHVVRVRAPGRAEAKLDLELKNGEHRDVGRRHHC